MSESAIENSDGVKHESVIANGWVRPEHRENHVGNIHDDRSLNQRIGDANWKPIMPTEVEHQHDGKIDTLEREVAAKRRDAEFGKLKTVEERALYSLREQREADFEAGERKQAEKKWLADQSEPLNRLAELRQAMAEADAGTFSIGSIVKIDQCKKQFSTYGSDLKIAGKMLSEIETQFAAVVEQEQLKIAAQLAGLENKKSALLGKLQRAVTEPEVENPEDKLFKAHYAAVQEAKAAGKTDLVEHLRHEYWSAKIARDEARKAGA